MQLCSASRYNCISMFQVLQKVSEYLPQTCCMVFPPEVSSESALQCRYSWRRSQGFQKSERQWSIPQHPRANKWLASVKILKTSVYEKWLMMIMFNKLNLTSAYRNPIEKYWRVYQQYCLIILFWMSPAKCTTNISSILQRIKCVTIFGQVLTDSLFPLRLT